MQAASSFIWGTCGNEGVWTIDDGNDYPRLWWENQPGDAISNVPLSHVLTGTGTQDDPFLIYTAEELNMIGLYPCEWDKHFKLVADVDLSGHDGKDDRPSFNIVGTGTGSFVSYPSAAFTGVLDGNGHTVSHLTITGGRFLGFVGRLTSRGEVKNLGVVDVNITGSGICVGGLVGYSQSGTVVNCYSTGAVSGQDYVGGLAGHNWDSDVTNCYSTCSASGSRSVGGLVGYNYEGHLTQCFSTGDVRGNSNVGGLVGEDSGGDVIRCYSAGAVSGDRYVGGLVGLVGYLRGSIAMSYSSGSVSGTDRVGGLVGYNWGYGSISTSFWDTQTSGQTASAPLLFK